MEERRNFIEVEDRQAKGKRSKDTTYLGILYGALGRFIGIPALLFVLFLVTVFFIIELSGGF